MKSATGSNIRNIELETGEKVFVQDLKKSMRKISDKIEFAKVPEGEAWRISSIKEAALVKAGQMFVKGFSPEEIEEIL